MASRPDPLKQKKQIRESMEKSRKDFNRNLQALISLSCKKNLADDQIQSIKEIFSAFMATNPSMIITAAGPYIWKYREQIAKRDDKFFIENTFENDVATFYGDVIPEEQNTFTEDDVSQVMRSLKRTWHLLNKSEKDVVWRHSTEILRSYAQFLGCSKKIIDVNAQLKNLTRK